MTRCWCCFRQRAWAFDIRWLLVLHRAYAVLAELVPSVPVQRIRRQNEAAMAPAFYSAHRLQSQPEQVRTKNSTVRIVFPAVCDPLPQGFNRYSSVIEQVPLVYCNP